MWLARWPWLVDGLAGWLAGCLAGYTDAPESQTITGRLCMLCRKGMYQYMIHVPELVLVLGTHPSRFFLGPGCVPRTASPSIALSLDTISTPYKCFLTTYMNPRLLILTIYIFNLPYPHHPEQWHPHGHQPAGSQIHPHSQISRSGGNMHYNAQATSILLLTFLSLSLSILTPSWSTRAVVVFRGCIFVFGFRWGHVHVLPPSPRPAMISQDTCPPPLFCLTSASSILGRTFLVDLK